VLLEGLIAITNYCYVFVTTISKVNKLDELGSEGGRVAPHAY
jgi:hypothetical protein